MTYKPTSYALNVGLMLERNCFTCLELSTIGLPGLPSTEQGWGKLVARESWNFVEVPAKGGKRGAKREYFPPPELLALIRRHMRGEVVTEEEVALARAAFPQAIGRMKRTRGASVANTNERHLAAATPATSGPAAELADGAASDTGWITDPTDADRLQMLLILLRTMEHRLKAPVSAEVAARILEAVDAWQDFAARQPDIRARLEAVRTAANLYLVR